jgi:hypothetical protein
MVSSLTRGSAVVRAEQETAASDPPNPDGSGTRITFQLAPFQLSASGAGRGVPSPVAPTAMHQRRHVQDTPANEPTNTGACTVDQWPPLN